MEFNETFSNSWKVLGPQVKKYSQETSLCPDLSMEFFVSAEFLKSAKDALAVLAILPLVCPSTRNYFLIESLRNHIGKMASTYQYQGDWAVVREILTTTDSLSVYQSWVHILPRMSEGDFYGNFVPRMVQALKSIKLRRRYISVMEDTRKVKKPQRKRGYSDKGSRRPFHKWLPWNAYAKEELHQTPVKEPRSFQWFGVKQNRRSE